MTQFNLLPAVKLEFVKAQRTKRLTILIATLVSGVSLAILILLFVGVQLVQKKHSRDLSNDIKTQSSQLEGTEDLDKILTIQNQLNNLTGLHDQKPVANRLFTYISQLTPNTVSIATLNTDFEANTISITGSANNLGSVNTFIDTLKFTTYDAGETKGVNAFSAVVLSGFGKDDKGTSYQITLSFDPQIFTGAESVKLVVPSQITTRSETEKPDSLFQPLSNPEDD